MKILALADRSVNENILSIIEKEEIDLVLLLGDLKYIDIAELKDAPVPIVGVVGNHCSFDYLESLNAKNAHGKIVKINDLSFFGYRGCPYYKGGQFESTQEECDRIIRENGEYADIFISHSPAEGINSTATSPHEVFRGLREYLTKHSSRLYFHGYSYPSKNQKISKFNDTVVYFVEGMEVIDAQELLSLEGLPEATTY